MLPMLATTRAWQSALAQQAPAQPLATLLAQLNDRLGQQWITFGNNQLAAVEQYEGRSKMGLQQGDKGGLLVGGGGVEEGARRASLGWRGGGCWQEGSGVRWQQRQNGRHFHCAVPANM
jgi:hypothetical protein